MRVFASAFVAALALFLTFGGADAVHKSEKKHEFEVVAHFNSSCSLITSIDPGAVLSFSCDYHHVADGALGEYWFNGQGAGIFSRVGYFQEYFTYIFNETSTIDFQGNSELQSLSTVRSIVGGTGVFRGARGSAKLRIEPQGGEAGTAFIFVALKFWSF